MSKLNTVSMEQVKNLLNYTIDNNNKLQENGVTPIAISLEATAGIGKTSIVEQVAKERNMNFTKLSLHEMDEPGDLVGYPQIEYECQVLKKTKTETGEVKVVIMPKTIWVNSKQVENNNNPSIKYQQTGKTRMSYAKPAWVPEYNENGTICLLDDYVRK